MWDKINRDADARKLGIRKRERERKKGGKKKMSR